MPNTRRKIHEGSSWAPNRPMFRRLLTYRDWLRSGKLFTAPDAARELEITERTVLDDMQYALTLGWDSYFCRKRRSWVSPSGVLPLPVLDLTEDEARALLVAEPALRAYGGGPLAGALTAALEKIVKSLDAPVSPERLPVTFEMHGVREPHPDLLDLFWRAIRRRDRLEMTYHNPETGEQLTRQIDPYLLDNYQGGWYVIAYCHSRKGFRDFAVSRHRMKKVTHTGQQYEPDATVDLEAYRRGGFGMFKSGERGMVELRFAPGQAVYQMERVGQPGEERELQPDGSLLVRFEAPINIGVVRWVLQYGSQVEVLGPEPLRTWIQKEVMAMGEQYTSIPSDDRTLNER